MTLEVPEPAPGCVDLADLVDTCDLIDGLVDQIDRREPLDPHERLTAWHRLRETYIALEVVLGQVEGDAVDAMKQLGVRDAVTPYGPVHTAWQPGSVKWRGYELLGKLAFGFVDPETGEKVDAVPVEVLRDVVAGCGSQKLTSSKWTQAGLDTWLPDQWQTFREYGQGRDRMRTGQRPKR